MKKYLIYLIALPVALASCVGTEDDLFDKSAAERINESMTEYDNLLRSASNGWVVEYYPEAGRAYGGYNLYFSFGNNETVAVGSEIYGYELAESLYSMNSDAGPTLNFDTYNPVLHYFCDPGLPVGGGAGLGFEGDYEFVMQSGNDSEVIMKGKKTQNTIRMTPLPDAMTWEQYVDIINLIIETSTAPVYAMTIDGQEVGLSHSYNTFTISYDEVSDGDTTTVWVPAPYIYTTTGIKFYEPVEIFDQTMQFFTLDASAQVFNAEGANAQIIMLFPTINEIFAGTDTQWIFSALCPSLTTLWDTADQLLRSAINEYIYLGYIGQSHWPEFPGMALAFLCFDGTYAYTAGYFMMFDIVEGTEDQIKITYNGEMFADGSYYEAAFVNFINAIKDKTYILTPDDKNNPSIITFVDVNDPTFYFTVEL